MQVQELLNAAESGDMAALTDLIKSGCDVNVQSRNGETALIRAAANGQLGVVEYLLANGADVNARRDDGLTALMSAAFSGHTEVVDMLLISRANRLAKDRLGLTAEEWAQYKGHVDIAHLLSGHASVYSEELGVGNTVSQKMRSGYVKVGETNKRSKEKQINSPVEISRLVKRNNEEPELQLLAEQQSQLSHVYLSLVLLAAFVVIGLLLYWNAGA